MRTCKSAATKEIPQRSARHLMLPTPSVLKKIIVLALIHCPTKIIVLDPGPTWTRLQAYYFCFSPSFASTRSIPTRRCSGGSPSESIDAEVERPEAEANPAAPPKQANVEAHPERALLPSFFLIHRPNEIQSRPWLRSTPSRRRDPCLAGRRDPCPADCVLLGHRHRGEAERLSTSRRKRICQRGDDHRQGGGSRH